MLPVLVLGFLVHVEATSNSRVARALSPRYLEVDGFKDCLIDMVKPGDQANVEYCFPLSQPAGCPINVWQEMGEAYKGKSRNKRSPQTAPGAPPPSAPPVNQCTATKDGRTKNCIFPFRYKFKTYNKCTRIDSDPKTGAKAWCATRVDSGDGITAIAGSYVDCDRGCPGYAPPCTANVKKPAPGGSVTVKENCQFPFKETSNSVTNTYNGCTRDGGENGKAWCQTTSGADAYCNPGCPGYVSSPTSRPTQRTTQRTPAPPGRLTVRLVDGGKPEVQVNGRYRPICGHYFWDNNYGADLFCKELDRKYRSGKITAGASGVFGQYTLGSDAIKIGKCREGDSWLRCSGGCNDNQVGGQCPSIRSNNGQCTTGARAGIKIECSTQRRQKKNTPRVRIIDNLAHVWRETGVTTSTSKSGWDWVPICGHYFWNNDIGARLFCQELGGTGGSVIGDHQFDNVILPSDGLQVGNCKSGDSWLKCTGGCNSLNIGGQCSGGGNCRAGTNGGVEIQCTGVPRTKRSLPPVYLNEIGHDQCLEKHSPPGANRTEYCLPATKPDDCSELSWDEIQNSFDGEDCPSNDLQIIGGISGLPPAHLSVRGHQKCLKDHYPAGESHTELCLPESRPNKCRKRAYKKLVEQIFL